MTSVSMCKTQNLGKTLHGKSANVFPAVVVVMDCREGPALHQGVSHL